MLDVIQRFDKHCSCHLQGEYVGWEFFGSLLPTPYEASKKYPANIFTLKIATAMFAETLDNFQHSTRLIPESRSFTFSRICFSDAPWFQDTLYHNSKTADYLAARSFVEGK
jgi:hypothetical protein